MNSTLFSSSFCDRQSLARWFFTAVMSVLMATAQTASAQAPTLTPYAPATNGIVSQKFDHTLLYTGTVTRFSATGLPSGLTLNATTGRLSGQLNVAGSYHIVIYAFNGTAKSTPLTIDWTVNPLPEGTVGTYYALIDRHDWYNGGYGGSLRITVTKTGTYSGTITRGIHRNPVVGRLETWPGAIDPQGIFTVARRSPYTPLTIDFGLPLGGNSIYGTLREPNGDVIDLDGLKTYTSAGGTPTAYVGRWNTAYELQQEQRGNATYPQGASWATQTISKTGVVTWVSRLADGTSNTFSTDLLVGGGTLAHLMLYGYAGSVQGWQYYDVEDGTTVGNLGWVKSANYTRFYSGGFPLHYLTGTGARYTPPPTLNDMIFGIAAGVNNVSLTFTEGGLAGPYTQVFSLGARNTITFPAGAGNPYGIRMTMNLSTGIVSGSGTALDFIENQPTNSRNGTFSALLIPGREQAVGHFLLPASRASNSQILSGKLIGQEYFVDN
ncbi:Ig domain-containing protein [Brevifollis gellanilyticus]|nr:Ig domain-containing protein [Brevifollis gellanilyticus]